MILWTRQMSRLAALTIVSCLVGVVAGIFSACGPDTMGPRLVDVHFIGGVKLYRLSDKEMAQSGWDGPWPNGPALVPRYVTGSEFGLLFDPLPMKKGQCDPFANGRLDLSLTRAGEAPVWSVAVPLRAPFLEQAGSGYRLSPVPNLPKGAPAKPASDLVLPDTPGLWRLTMTWRCGSETRGHREDVRLLAVQPPFKDTDEGRRVDEIDKLPPDARAEAFDALFREPHSDRAGLWIAGPAVQALKNVGHYERAESLALSWAELADHVGYPSEAVLAFNAAHESARDQGKLILALDYLDRSMELVRKLDYQVWFPESYYSYAFLLNRLGRTGSALDMAVKAERQARRVGKRYFQLEATRLKLSILQSLGHHRVVNRGLEALVAELESTAAERHIHPRLPVGLLNNVGWLLLRGVEAGMPLGGDRESALERAATLFEAALTRIEPTQPYRVTMMANVAYTALLQGRLDDAQAWIERADRSMAPGDPELLLFLTRVKAELALARGRYDDALARFTALEKDAASHNLVKYAGDGAFGAGEVYRKTGDLEKALDAYDRALERVEANDAMPSPLHEATLLADRVPWEARAVQVCLDLHRDIEALGRVERYAWARWRSQIRSGRRDNLSPDEEAEVHRLEREIEDLDQTIARERRVPIAGSAERLDQAEAQRETAWARIETVLGDAQNDSPPPLDLDRVRAWLPDGGILVRPAALPEELIVWTVDRSHVSTRRIPVSRGHVEAQAEAWTQACQHDTETDAGKQISDWLLEDIGDASAIVVVADGVLRTIPWSALPWAGDYLIAQHDLVVVPNLFWRPPDPPQPAGAPLLVVNATGDLPGAAREGDQLAITWPACQRLTGDAATREVLMTRLPGVSRFHFAGHAVVDDERPFLSGLELARGERLTKMDLRSLRLSGPTIFLNACGAGRVARAGGGTLGIADGFVASGARAVVATLWDVPDRLSAEVPPLFYRYVDAERLPPWVAMSRAQRDLARGGNAELGRRCSLWSAYQVLGDPLPRGPTGTSPGG